MDLREKSDSQNDILQYLLSHCKMSLDEIAIEIEIETMSNQKILAQHCYFITENKDGRISSYLPDKTKKNHCRKIVKKTRELLEKQITKFYKEREKQQSIQNTTLRQFYPEWSEYKSLPTNSSVYMRMIDELWKRFYINDPIADRSLVELDECTLDT